MTDKTLMRAEVEEIPAAVERLLTGGAQATRNAAMAIAEIDPRFLITVARGSSDHVCSYLKYASELTLGLPVASIGPSVASIYGAQLKLKESLCIAVSQSGQSPDIVGMTQAARDADSYTVAITNKTDSPLAAAANSTLDVHAGPELSVAATKTFVTSAAAGMWLLATLKGDGELLSAINGLPDALEAAIGCDWSAVIAAIGGGSLYTLGRGPALSVSNEAALKFKETCQIHAESYSSAEVLHGPVSIIDQGFPVLAFAAADAAEHSLAEVADALASKGAAVFVTSGRVGKAQPVPFRRTGHWLTDPLALIVSFYAMVEQVAAARGINPDMPRHLKKVTETL